MQFFATVALLVSAVAVSAQEYSDPAMPAMPKAPHHEPAPAKVQACGNDQKLSCCNSGESNIPVLGGACELPILGQSCGGNKAFCCDATQNGLINVGSLCLPITL